MSVDSTISTVSTNGAIPDAISPVEPPLLDLSFMDLPLLNHPRPELAAQTRPDEATIAVGTRVLLVDDNREHRYLLAAHLYRAGCSVIEVENAEQAMPVFLETTPDITIVDLLLPGMTGTALVRWLRECGRPACTVITTSVLDADRHPASDGVLVKPFTRTEVVQMLQTFVERSSAA